MDIFSILVGILIAALIIFIFNQLTYWSRKGVPSYVPIPVLGNRFALPVFRPSITNYCNDLHKLHENSRYYGLMLFNGPIVYLRDTELIKEIYIKNFDFLPDHRSFIDERFDPIFGKNVFSLRGERWRQVRSALSPSFTMSKMKFLFELISKASKDFVDYLYNNPDLCQILDTKDAFTRYTNDVIATSAFGLQVNSMKDRENEFYLRGKDATNLTGTKRIIKFMMGIFFPRLMRALGFSYLTRETKNFFVKLIHDTVKYREQSGTVRPDMIHLLMQARETADFKLTIDDIVAQAFIFFLAGFDTSSTLMSFAAHQLAFNQDIQDRLRKEVDELFAENAEVSYETLSKMTYMEMVLSETLRLYPPVVLIDRVVSKKFDIPSSIKGNDIDRVTIEPDTTFWLPVYALHRDEKYFPDPEKFDPERFNHENKEKIVPYSYNPFGLGPRKCIGERFALMETKILLARLLKKFIIKPSVKSREKIVMDKKSLNLVPEGGIWLKFEKRN